jgi:hypothetical protein
MFRQRSQLSPPKIESTAVLIADVTFLTVFLSVKSKHQQRVAERLIRLSANGEREAIGCGVEGARVCRASRNRAVSPAGAAHLSMDALL